MVEKTKTTKILSVTRRPAALSGVKQLWRANSKTLGFFPEGAFEDAARRGTILIALDNNDQCVGYLLFRQGKQRITIVHLCVDNAQRGKGTARQLVNQLILNTKNAAGIALKCRRDYEANIMWASLGFVVQDEVPGRARKGARLVCWWRPHAERTLFAEAAANLKESKLCVVIDANIFFDLQENASEKTTPSHALIADWLRESLELLVTEEIFNEINRRDDIYERSRSRENAIGFHTIPCDSDAFDKVSKQLRPIFSTNKMTERDQSDLRHLARTIGGDAKYFVTRDEQLLGHADAVEEQFGVNILDPTSLVIKLDQLRREAAYQPARFVGSRVTIRRVRGEEIKAISQRFVNTQRGEKQRSLRQRIAAYAASPRKYDLFVIEDRDALASVVVFKISSEMTDELEVLLLRVAPGQSGPTWLRQMIRYCIRKSQRFDLPIVRISDKPLVDEAESALYEYGFFEMPTGWVKINIRGALTGQEAADTLRSFEDHPALESRGLEEWAEILRDKATLADTNRTAEEEHRLWPLKISDSKMPNYIVPIQPRWAEELFDEKLASQALFGRRIELALNSEAVYYRSDRGPQLIAPARILWYVSGDDHVEGSKCIRACSSLVEVTRDKPKVLFKQFKRLGVYEWPQVFETAHCNIDEQIMAIRFRDTELLARPIPFHRANQLLAEDGQKNQFQSPVCITSDIFLKLYREGSR